MTLVWSLGGWLVQFPSSADPGKVESSKGAVAPPSASFPPLCLSLALLLPPSDALTEELELLAWIVASAGAWKL